MTNGIDDDGLGLTEDQIWSLGDGNVEFEEKMDGYIAKKSRDQMEAVSAAQQQENNLVWQKVCQADGLKSQAEFYQVQKADPGRAANIIANYHGALSQKFRSGAPRSTPQPAGAPQRRSLAPQGQKRLTSVRVDIDRFNALKEKAQTSTPLTDEEQLEAINIATEGLAWE